MPVLFQTLRYYSHKCASCPHLSEAWVGFFFPAAVQGVSSLRRGTFSVLKGKKKRKSLIWVLYDYLQQLSFYIKVLISFHSRLLCG